MNKKKDINYRDRVKKTAERLVLLYESGSLFYEENGDEKCSGLLTLGELAVAFKLLAVSKDLSSEEVLETAAENLELINESVQRNSIDPIHPKRLIRLSKINTLARLGHYHDEGTPRLSLKWRLTTAECDEWMSECLDLSFSPSLDELFNGKNRKINSPGQSFVSTQSDATVIQIQPPDAALTNQSSRQQHRIKTRKDQLDAQIEAARKMANDPNNHNDVWIQLKEMAMDQCLPFNGHFTDEGLYFTSNSEDIKIFTKEALRKRLSRNKII